MTILWVDDDPGIQRLAHMMLGEQHEIDTALNGREALDKFAERPFDAVITDFSMPGLNGCQLIARLRAEQPSLPCVLVTGSLMDSWEPEAARLGAPIVRKPFRVKEILEMVEGLGQSVPSAL